MRGCKWCERDGFRIDVIPEDCESGRRKTKALRVAVFMIFVLVCCASCSSAVKSLCLSVLRAARWGIKPPNCHRRNHLCDHRPGFNECENKHFYYSFSAAPRGGGPCAEGCVRSLKFEFRMNHPSIAPKNRRAKRQRQQNGFEQRTTISGNLAALRNTPNLNRATSSATTNKRTGKKNNNNNGDDLAPRCPPQLQSVETKSGDNVRKLEILPSRFDVGQRQQNGFEQRTTISGNLAALRNTPNLNRATSSATTNKRTGKKNNNNNGDDLAPRCPPQLQSVETKSGDNVRKLEILPSRFDVGEQSFRRHDHRDARTTTKSESSRLNFVFYLRSK
ncbi:hypothetical protein FQR65_LT14879 [Abscondita terminalis]|nr:hypothetical protein FQR65_LT14879 [Abscondita terminalis]